MHFFLFILETIGTQELILVGLVALIVFGPRRLPQMARKFGKMMTELRKVSNDFKATWEREASMVEDAFKVEDERNEPKPVGRSTVPYLNGVADDKGPDLPAVREVSSEELEKLKDKERAPEQTNEDPQVTNETDSPASSKQDWL